MLIGLNLDQPFEKRVKVAEEIAKTMKGTTRVYSPKDEFDFITVLKSYKPATENLIFLHTHYAYADKYGEALWRVTDIHFDNKGGSIWGKQPPKPSGSHVADLTEDVDLELVGKYALYAEERRKLIRKQVGGQYFGRVTYDPHTLVVGFVPSLPKMSNPADYFIRSLQDPPKNINTKVRTFGGWHGVGFIRPDKNALKAADWFDASIIAAGENAHNLLESNGIEHSSIPSLNDVYRKGVDVDLRLGALISTLSQSSDYQDRRDWSAV